jgi:hypothetical protein
MARRQGLTLHRNPRRDTLAADYGTYQLNEAGTFNGTFLTPAAQPGPLSGVVLRYASPDEIERWLNGERSQP